MTRTLTLIAFSMGALISACPAMAQVTDDELARTHYAAAISYLEQRRYAEAAAQFEEAYRLSERAELLLNVATAYERAEEPGLAAAAIERWLSVVPADAPSRKTQATRMEQLRATQARHDQERAEREAAEAQPEPAPAQVTTDPTSAEPARDRGLGAKGVAGVSLFGGGAALAIVAVATGVASNAKLSTLESECAGLDCPEHLRDDRDRGKALGTASTVTTFVSVAALGAGAVMLFLDLRKRRSRDRDPEAASVRMTSGPGQAGAGLELRF